MAVTQKAHIGKTAGRVKAVMKLYGGDYTAAKCEYSSTHSVAIRVRTIDPMFSSLTKLARHRYGSKYLDKSTETELMQLCVVLLMSPEEAREPWADPVSNDAIMDGDHSLQPKLY